MRILRWLLAVLVVAVLGIAGLFVAARFLDGPLALIPGGPLRSGELVETPVSDWSFARDVQEIELQLQSSRRSRTVWVVVHESQAYVPCSLDFPPLKRWHQEALDDGRALVRIDGRRYPVHLVLMTDETLVPELVEAARAKYPAPPGSSPDRIWFFRMEPVR